MNTRPPPDPGGDPPDGVHGGRTEVNWDQGRGRQPYVNQDEDASGPPGGGDEFPAGDRGDLSGRHQEQLERVRIKP